MATKTLGHAAFYKEFSDWLLKTIGIKYGGHQNHVQKKDSETTKKADQNHQKRRRRKIQRLQIREIHDLYGYVPPNGVVIVKLLM